MLKKYASGRERDCKDERESNATKTCLGSFRLQRFIYVISFLFSLSAFVHLNDLLLSCVGEWGRGGKMENWKLLIDGFIFCSCHLFVSKYFPWFIREFCERKKKNWINLMNLLNLLLLKIKIVIDLKFHIFSWLN